MINVDAVTSEKVAKKKVAELIHNGYHADYLWIPDYASLTGLKAFAVYIGPYTNQHDCEVATEKYRLNNPDAYGLLVSKKKERVEIYGVGIVDEIPNWRGNEDDSTIK